MKSTLRYPHLWDGKSACKNTDRCTLFEQIKLIKLFAETRGIRGVRALNPRIYSPVEKTYATAVER